MTLKSPANTRKTKGFRDLLSVLIRRICGQESVDNEGLSCYF